MTSPAIQAKHLRKSYGRVEAVRDLTLSVEPNRITGFLGGNGAGKSTTIKMLLGMVLPTAGEATVLGIKIDDAQESVELRRRIAYVGEDKRLYAYMTVMQLIRFTSSFYPDWRYDLAASLLQKYELPPGGKVSQLSKGMRTKLALLLALSRRPALLILDEPGEGLDPGGVEQLLESLVAQCSEGATVFFSTHQISEVERIADDVCIVDKGRVVLSESLDNLRQSYRHIKLAFPSLPEEGEFRVPGVESIKTQGHQMSVVVSKNAEAVVERGREFYANSIEVSPVDLREIFLETVKDN